MNQRCKIVLLLLSVLGAAALALYVHILWEPSYQGRSLSRWLADFDSESVETRAQAAEALRQMGTKALPFIVARLRQQDSPLKLKIEKLLSHLPLFKFNFASAGKWQQRALAACDALGPTATDALPALEELLYTDQPAPDLVYVMARLGPEAVPVLMKASTNETKVIRMCARVCLDLYQAHSEILFPPSGAALADADFNRRICVYHLKVLGASFLEFKSWRPESALPLSFPDN